MLYSNLTIIFFLFSLTMKIMIIIAIIMNRQQVKLNNSDIQLLPTYFTYSIFIIFILLLSSSSSQHLKNDNNNQIQTIAPAIYMITASNQNITIFQNNNYNKLFIDQSRPLYCSQNKLYTYQQTELQYKDNIPYNIYVKNSTKFKLTILTQHEIIHPIANLASCNKTICRISVKNGCPQLSIWSYYDRIKFHIDGFQTFSYDVICDKSFYNVSFSFGKSIAICVVILFLALIARISRANSISGQGISVNIWMLLVFMGIVILCALIGIFVLVVLRFFIEIISFIIGTIGVAFCCNELLYLIKFRILHFGCKIWKIYFRVIEFIGVLFGIGMTCCWWFTGRNWILNDILCLCAVATAIKIFKFTSLKMAAMGVLSIILVELLFLLLMYFIPQENYNRQLINQINGAVLLQIPTINVIYGQKCNWISIVSITYQGIVLSYLRRFDTSRNTKIYYIIGVTVLSIGSLIWVLISLGSPVNLPFGFVTDPLTIILVLFFAYKRKQIRVIWDGQFYDEQFADRKGMENLKQSIGAQKQMVEFRKSLLEGLKIQQSQRQSVMSYNINDAKKNQT